MAEAAKRPVMFGAMWCGDCRRSKALLDRLDIDVEFIDLTEHPDRAAEAQAVSGRPNIPVIVFGDGLVLVEPSDDELSAALGERGLGR
jgi:glutaredoxin